MASLAFRSKISHTLPSAPPSAAMEVRPPLKLPVPISASSLSRSHIQPPFHRSLTGHTMIRELLDYIGRLVDERIVKPENDLISKLVVEQVNAPLIASILVSSTAHCWWICGASQITPGHITKADALQIAFLLLVAGNATVVNMINLVRNHPSSPHHGAYF